MADDELELFDCIPQLKGADGSDIGLAAISLRRALFSSAPTGGKKASGKGTAAMYLRMVTNQSGATLSNLALVSSLSHPAEIISGAAEDDGREVFSGAFASLVFGDTSAWSYSPIIERTLTLNKATSSPVHIKFSNHSEATYFCMTVASALAQLPSVIEHKFMIAQLLHQGRNFESNKDNEDMDPDNSKEVSLTTLSLNVFESRTLEFVKNANFTASESGGGGDNAAPTARFTTEWLANDAAPTIDQLAYLKPLFLLEGNELLLAVRGDVLKNHWNFFEELVGTEGAYEDHIFVIGVRVTSVLDASEARERRLKSRLQNTGARMSVNVTADAVRARSSSLRKSLPYATVGASSSPTTPATPDNAASNSLANEIAKARASMKHVDEGEVGRSRGSSMMNSFSSQQNANASPANANANANANASSSASCPAPSLPRKKTDISITTDNKEHSPSARPPLQPQPQTNPTGGTNKKGPAAVVATTKLLDGVTDMNGTAFDDDDDDDVRISPLTNAFFKGDVTVSSDNFGGTSTYSLNEKGGGGGGATKGTYTPVSPVSTPTSPTNPYPSQKSRGGEEDLTEKSKKRAKGDQKEDKSNTAAKKHQKRSTSANDEEQQSRLREEIIETVGRAAEDEGANSKAEEETVIMSAEELERLSAKLKRRKAKIESAELVVADMEAEVLRRHELMTQEQSELADERQRLEQYRAALDAQQRQLTSQQNEIVHQQRIGIANAVAAATSASVNSDTNAINMRSIGRRKNNSSRNSGEAQPLLEVGHGDADQYVFRLEHEFYDSKDMPPGMLRRMPFTCAYTKYLALSRPITIAILVGIAAALIVLIWRMAGEGEAFVWPMAVVFAVCGIIIGVHARSTPLFFDLYHAVDQSMHGNSGQADPHAAGYMYEWSPMTITLVFLTIASTLGSAGLVGFRDVSLASRIAFAFGAALCALGVGSILVNLSLVTHVMWYRIASTVPRNHGSLFTRVSIRAAAARYQYAKQLVDVGSRRFSPTVLVIAATSIVTVAFCPCYMFVISDTHQGHLAGSVGFTCAATVLFSLVVLMSSWEGATRQVIGNMGVQADRWVRGDYNNESDARLEDYVAAQQLLVNNLLSGEYAKWTIDFVPFLREGKSDAVPADFRNFVIGWPYRIFSFGLLLLGIIVIPIVASEKVGGL